MTDLTLIEQTRVNRARLAGALLLGPAARTRGRVPLMQRLIVGVVIAAVAAAACVGTSFVLGILDEQRQAKLEQERARASAMFVIDDRVFETETVPLGAGGHSVARHGEQQDGGER